MTQIKHFPRSQSLTRPGAQTNGSSLQGCDTSAIRPPGSRGGKCILRNYRYFPTPGALEFPSLTSYPSRALHPINVPEYAEDVHFFSTQTDPTNSYQTGYRGAD